MKLRSYVATVSSKAIQLCVEDSSDGLQELQDKFFERVWSSIWKKPKGFQSQVTLENWRLHRHRQKLMELSARGKRVPDLEACQTVTPCDASGDPTQQFSELWGDH